MPGGGETAGSLALDQGLERARTAWPPGLLLLGLGLAYASLAPGVIDGDGIGYLKLIPEHALSPGHPLYVPLLRLIALAVPHQTLLELVSPLRLASTGMALAALGLFYDAGRRFYPPAHALAATSLLGVTHAYWRMAQEIESYAPATLLAVAGLWALARFSRSRRRVCWAAVAGVLMALAAGFHLTLALLGVPLLLLLLRWGGPSRWRAAAVGAALFTVVLLAVLTWALRHDEVLAPQGALRWLRGANHGLAYPVSRYTPLATLWGICRTLIASPYPYEAPWRLVIASAVVGGLGWLALLASGRRAPARAAGLDGWFLASWGAGPALFAVTFFPADTDRWIFILPAAVLLLARISPRRLAVLGVAVLTLNAAARLPRALDRSDLDRALAVDVRLSPGDLVVSPGHGWDELVGLSLPFPVRRFPLIYFIGRERGLTAAETAMRAAIDQAFAAGASVFVARMRDPRDRRGQEILGGQGLSSEAFAALFERYRPRPVADGLWQLARAHRRLSAGAHRRRSSSWSSDLRFLWCSSYSRIRRSSGLDRRPILRLI